MLALYISLLDTEEQISKVSFSCILLLYVNLL